MNSLEHVRIMRIDWGTKCSNFAPAWDGKFSNAVVFCWAVRCFLGVFLSRHSLLYLDKINLRNFSYLRIPYSIIINPDEAGKIVIDKYLFILMRSISICLLNFKWISSANVIIN